MLLHEDIRPPDLLTSVFMISNVTQVRTD